MSVERINPESSTDSASSHGPAVPFRAPLTPEASFAQSAEKKAKRNRKKRKKELNNIAAKQQAASEAKGQVSHNTSSLAVSGGEFTLWQRPESPKDKASAKLGERVIDVARRQEEKPMAETSEPEWVPQTMVRPPEGGYEPVPPLQPPDPVSYRRRFWNEPPVPMSDAAAGDLPPPHRYESLPREPAYRSATQRVEAPVVPPMVAKKFESDIAPGYQRSTADVSRAAWTGLLAGWWIGRRGKRKAVERARQAGRKEGVRTAAATQPLPERQRSHVESPYYSSPQLEAEPLHIYPSPEAGRTMIRPLSAATRDPLRSPEQRPIVTPSVAVAVFERLVIHSALERRVEASPAIKLAAAKAAEAVVVRPSESVPRSGAEHQLGKRELMRLSKDIKIDGVPLKEIYKSKKIDEVGLRTVVDTYLRGGDVRQQLAEEIVVKEQSYERDPVLRHQRLIGERKVGSRSGRAGFGSGGAGQALSRALGAVAASTGSTARSAGRAIASGARTAQRDIIDNSNTTDWLSITAVVVLYSVILLLLVT